MKFNPHLPARTRSGFPLRIISTDRRDAAFPIVALYEDGTGEGVLTLLADGRCLDLPKELDDWPAAGNPNDALNITDNDPVMSEAKRLYNLDMVSQEAPTLPFESLLPRQKAPYMHRAAKGLNQCPDLLTIKEARLPTTLQEAVDHLSTAFGSIHDDPTAAAVNRVISVYQQERFALNGLSKLMGDVCQAPTMAEGYAILEDWCTSCGFPQPTAFPAVMGDIVAERRRQIEVEGWSLEHDDQHHDGSMARAAAVYAYVATLTNDSRETHKGAMWGMAQGFVSIVRMLWPWAPQWFKPTTPRRDLVKASALLLAEIERLDRAKTRNLQAAG